MQVMKICIAISIRAFSIFMHFGVGSSEIVLIFLQYKYQINIDGTVAAYRLPYLLIGDSVVIKQDSEYYEHFYHQLEPYKHYIPMKSDLSDIVELVQWLIGNDDTVSTMTNAALNHFLFPGKGD